jgi:hypothetical protein
MVMCSTKNTENFYGSGGLSGQGPQLRLIKAFCGAALEPSTGHRNRMGWEHLQKKRIKHQMD